jgi:NAD(P)-dependent dehydrogenase (short-subunit alcohol dehydrogenase family)
LSKLTGQTAVITGGRSGIGLSTAELFVSEGAYVYITGRRQKELDAAIAKIKYNVTGVQGDVSNLEDLASQDSGNVAGVELFVDGGMGQI